MYTCIYACVIPYIDREREGEAHEGGVDLGRCIYTYIISIGKSGMHAVHYIIRGGAGQVSWSTSSLAGYKNLLLKPRAQIFQYSNYKTAVRAMVV